MPIELVNMPMHVVSSMQCGDELVPADVSAVDASDGLDCDGEEGQVLYIDSYDAGHIMDRDELG